MPRFRKKPIEIEAIQYTRKNRNECIAFCDAIHMAIDDDGAQYELENLRIKTLEGTMTAKLGDWVIKGVKGEFYPCKPDIFEATYDILDIKAVDE